MRSLPIAIWRASSRCHAMRLLRVSKALDYANRFLCSCWIPGTARLGQGVVVGYQGLGIVIHKDAVIGNGVHIDQGVTIGGNAKEIGVPVIEDNVYIGAGSKVLGPIRVGKGAIIGANAVVLTSLPPGCTAVGVPARMISR